MWNIFDGMFVRQKAGITAKPVADKHNYSITDKDGDVLFAAEATEEVARKRAAKYAVTDGCNTPHYLYKLERAGRFITEVKEEK